MPVINENAFVAAFTSGRLNVGHLPYHFRARQVPAGVRLDEDSAKKLFADLRGYVREGGSMGKTLRPWDFGDGIFANLDRNQPWWGFEFETGWRSQAARREAVDHVWDNYEGCMFDGEGEGDYQVEITFSPAEMRSYLNGTAPAYKFIEWVSEHPSLSYMGGENNVGTHLNMSDPRFKGGNVESLVRFLNRTLHFTVAVNGQRKQLFGRETLYAGFFANESNNGANRWMEFKGFRTTYELDTFRRYLQTATALQRCIDTFYDLGAGKAADHAVSNLYDVAFNGADPIVKPFIEVKAAAGAARLHSRYQFGNI